MDMRERKTLRAIRQAFLRLRAQRPVEKITVKELAELAEISKATFYLHYRDIYDLSERLQREAIAAICQDIGHPDWVVTAPADFARELFCAFRSQKELVDTLFSGAGESVLPKSVEAELRERIFESHPHLKRDARFNVLLTFQVQGGYFSYSANRRRFPEDQVVQEIARGVEALSRAREEKTCPAP